MRRLAIMQNGTQSVAISIVHMQNKEHKLVLDQICTLCKLLFASYLEVQFSQKWLIIWLIAMSNAMSGLGLSQQYIFTSDMIPIFQSGVSANMAVNTMSARYR